MKPGLTTIDLI